MNKGAIINARLVNQGIASPLPGPPAQAVARLAAMQAQDAAAVRWAIGLRCQNATLATVEQALNSGTIIRTWLLRGTLHVAAAEDVRWLLALLAPRILAGGVGRRRQLGLDDATLTRSLSVIGDALHDGMAMTRAELLHALDEAGIATAGQRGYHLLGHAALHGLICFGPAQGKQETFVLLDERAPATAHLDPDAALGKLALRYFTGHGPATLADFAWWAGLPLGQARQALALVAADLTQVTAGDRRYFYAHGEQTADDRAVPAVYLLPAFDEYYLGYKERDLVLAPGLDKRVVSSNGIFRPVIVVDGQVEGIWRRERNGTGVRTQIERFGALDSLEAQALDATLRQYTTFLS